MRFGVIPLAKWHLRSLQHTLYCQATALSNFPSAAILFTHLGAWNCCPGSEESFCTSGQVLVLQCKHCAHRYEFLLLSFLWLYIGVIGNLEKIKVTYFVNYNYSLNSPSLSFSFFFERGLRGQRTAAVVPALVLFVCLFGWHCPKINFEGGKWCEGSSVGLNRGEVSRSCI